MYKETALKARLCHC